MDKAYEAKQHEQTLYQMWEAGGYFMPRENTDGKYFSIVLPPPNANGDLHVGHAVMTVEDMLIRYHRMRGESTLFVPGADHAGFETQFVFEKFLAKKDQSRFDFPRDELYKMIWDFVHQYRGTMENQLRRLGFSLDWSRNVFTLDPEVVKTVYKTFKKLHDDGLVYRGARLVNYCTKCGTGFSDLEAKHIEQTDPLYYMKYGPFVLATVRPETKFGDTAVAVNPKDRRYKKWVGKEIEVEGLLGKFTLRVIADSAIDPKFGTGVIKVTPAHDPTDYDIGQRHGLPMKQVIGFNGKLNESTGPYAGLRIKAARAKVVEDLSVKGLIDHIDEKYVHTVSVCYRCGTVLEPLPMQQWFIKVRPLADAAKKAVKEKQINFVPKRFEKIANMWLTNFHDWNISRQIVWGMRVPAWKCVDCDSKPRTENQEPRTDVDAWIVTEGETPSECPVCHGHNLEQDTDTFDTWFSSGQWPFATLKATSVKRSGTGDQGPDTSSDFEKFYPLSVMETGYDILPAWVCRMMMLGLYATGKVPFQTVYLHGLVRDGKGQKMSKSKGNVINPLEMVDRYGADALRMALVYGTAAGNDQALSEDKIRGMRNFANKLWNMGRFLMMNIEEYEKNTGKALPFYDEQMHAALNNTHDKRIIAELNMLVASVTKNFDTYRLSDAAQKLYDFAWKKVADVHLEKNKERFKAGDEQALAVLRHVYITIVKLTHPFMPFVTEAIWQQVTKNVQNPLIVSSWPGVEKNL